MRKSIILLGIILLSVLNNGYGQMTLATNLPTSYFELTEIVNLSRSGKKIMTVRDQSSINLADTLFFYNLDYSFWKSMPCPAQPGYSGYFTFYYFVGQSPGIFYPSETLFNLDTLLEVAIL